MPRGLVKVSLGASIDRAISKRVQLFRTSEDSHPQEAEAHAQKKDVDYLANAEDMGPRPDEHGRRYDSNG